jgi:hypothetical protein
MLLQTAVEADLRWNAVNSQKHNLKQAVCAVFFMIHYPKIEKSS